MTDFNENNLNEKNNEQNRQTGQGGDPYKTTGGNSGWQPPSQNQYQAGQYNPRTGWQQPPNTGYYSANYQNNYNKAQGAQHTPEEEYKWNFAEYENGAKDPKKVKKKNKGLMVFTGIVCSMLAVAVIGFAGFGIYNLVDQNGLQPAASAAGSPADPALPGLNINDIPATTESIAQGGVLTTKQIAAKVQPSVVGIVVYTNNPDAYNIYGFGQNGGASPIQTSEGSGIIMSSDGYIITNAHVVKGASGMKVVLYNGEEHDAKLVGSDENTDLAVIKVEASNLTPAEFGDSSQLSVGEDVLAIGNPGGLEFASSVTKGIISGVNRPIRSNDAGYTMNCIQTDAAINPGNSGGALVNEYGQVVGINSSKIAATNYEGLGFAIPISEAKPIVDDLIANGRVTGRVKLGITGVMVDETTARFNSVPVGFMVYQTDAGSDIAAKGVVAGDIITRIDGKDISDRSVISDHIKSFKAGDKVTLTVFRRTSGRQDSTFEVTIALMEDSGDTEVPQVAPQNSKGGNNFFSFLQ